jgi:tetratricopeptide (TPR) repeat protein
MVSDKDLEKWVKLGQNSETFERAIEYCDVALKTDPGNFDIWWTKTKILYYANKSEQALNVFNEALTKDLDFIYMPTEELLDFDETIALQIFNKALKSNPDDYNMWLSKYRFLEESNKPKDALNVFDEAFKASSNNVDEIIACLWEFPEIELQVIDKALKVKPQSIELLSEKANYLFWDETYDEAVEVIDQALEIEPDNISLLGVKAEYLYNAEKYDEIEKIADKVEKRTFEDISSLKDKANILGYAKRSDKALEVIDEALEYADRNDRTVGDGDEEFEYEPQNVQLLRKKIGLLFLAKRENDIIQFYENLMEQENKEYMISDQDISIISSLKNEDINRKIYSYLYNKGLYFYNKGVEGLDDNLNYAFDYFHKAEKIDKNIDVIIKKGDSKFKLENYRQSRLQYNKAINLDSNSAEAWYKKGMALEEIGEQKEAKECFDKALAIDPEFNPNFDHKMISAQPPAQLSPFNNLLEKKKQIILYGPPGTSKTFKTKEHAVSFIRG